MRQGAVVVKEFSALEVSKDEQAEKEVPGASDVKQCFLLLKAYASTEPKQLNN